MDKPASIRRVELMEKIIIDINAAQLPPYVVAKILEDVLKDASRKIKIQYETDLRTWHEAQAKEVKCDGEDTAADDNA